MMLYMDDDIESKIYDPMTGEEIEVESQQQAEDAYIEKSIAQADYLKRMKRDDGWDIVQSWLQGSIDNYVEALVGTTEVDRLRRLQEAIKCYRSILNFVDAKILEGESFQKMKNQTRNSG